jgi:hypothetical protein
VLLRHAGTIESIAELARAEGIELPLRRVPPSATLGLEVGESIERSAMLLLGGLGVLQLLKGRVLPPALTLFWYAAALAREAPPTPPDGEA